MLIDMHLNRGTIKSIPRPRGNNIGQAETSITGDRVPLSAPSLSAAADRARGILFMITRLLLVGLACELRDGHGLGLSASLCSA